MTAASSKNPLPKEVPIYSQSFREVATAITPLLRDNSIGVFEFARVYDNGSCSIFSNEPTLVPYLFTSGIHITVHVPKTLVKRKFWYLIPQNDERYQPGVRHFREHYKVRTLVDFIDRHPGFYDMFVFCHRQENDTATNFFLNNRDSLEQFSFEFRDRISDLLKSVKNYPLMLPDHMLPNIKGLDSNEDPYDRNLDHVLNNLSKGWTELSAMHSLSPREKECIKHLMLGQTAKTTAATMGLSPRTVEYYLENVKSKLGCEKKTDIVRLLGAFENTQ